ncbi:MAG: beta-ketoacyl-ACP synthase III [Acidimicrobiia bacterium]
MRDAIITGWGKCLPPAVLSNSDLETVTDTSDEWITTRTGIKERRISHVETSDLSAVAAQRAMASAGVTAEDLDLILVATCSPDRLIPSAATMVQAKIGASNAAGMDLNAACSGFVFALSTADQMIKTGAMDTVLIVGAEKMSYWLDFSNRATSVLFGDGAGAVVVQAAEEGTDGGLLAFELGSDGTAGGLLCVPASGTEGRADRSELPTIEMEGPEVFKRAVTSMADASMRVLAAAGLEMSDVDLLIPHQANVRIIDATARRLNLAPEKVFVNIASYGNTSAATIPIAIAEAIEDGRIEPGATVVFAAFGGGFTWAAAVYRWGPRIEPLGISDAELPPNDKTALELLAGNIALHGTGV